MNFFFGIALSALLLHYPLSQKASASDAGLIVATEQGPVSGTFAAPTVRQFLGIPFASGRRWEAPGKPSTRSSVLKATQYSDSCIQAFSPANIQLTELLGGGGLNVSESEDCLTVNIWVPSVDRKQQTSVLLWVYGGDFQLGTSNNPVYNGQIFVRDNDDIAIVTFNYRTNIFGQPNAPQLASNSSSQNFGLLDLEAAVGWIHDNIASFGGDPERISLFGQSAGSAAVDAYTFSHRQDTIIKGVIEESGTISLIDSTALLNETAWSVVASHVGCGSVPDAAQLLCMKKVPSETLKNAVIFTGASFNLLVDNITIYSDTPSRAAAGTFLKVPLLGGSNLNEADVLVVANELASTGIALPFVTEVTADIETQALFTCPAGATAQNRLRAQVPTWRYQYQGVFPDISSRPDLRAFHASEIPITFGTYNSSILAPPTPVEITLSKYVQAAWVAFARNPSQGLLEFGWPMYSPDTTSLAQLGNAANATGVVFTKGEFLDATCNAVQQLFEISAQLSSIVSA